MCRAASAAGVLDACVKAAAEGGAVGGHCALGWFQGGTRVGRSGLGCGCIAGKPSAGEGNLMCQSCRGVAKGRIAGKPPPRRRKSYVPVVRCCARQCGQGDCVASWW